MAKAIPGQVPARSSDRKALPCDGQRFLKILDVEPGVSAQAFQHIAFPQLAGLDVELAFLPLIVRLDTVTGNGSLPPTQKMSRCRAIFARLLVAFDHLFRPPM